VYNDGRICLGSAHIGTKKEATYEKEIERFERGFFMAEQNGGHADNRKKKTPLSVLWSQLIKNGKHFPVDELTPHQKVKTVQDILKGRRA
jgi:hypothetical protein